MTARTAVALPAAIVLAIVLAAAPARAGQLQVRVLDGDGQPVPEAVVSLHSDATRPVPGRSVMDQRNTAFEPGVLVVQAGTAVSFPNSDTVRHQVYSFSPAKPFELPLYSGTPPEPVVFDQPGIVVVGCNIHDWMIGWIVVLDTPLHARSGADGVARLEAPDGAYQLRAWHPRLEGAPVAADVRVAAAAPAVEVALALGPPPPDRRGNDRLRALQDRLRSLRQED